MNTGSGNPANPSIRSPDAMVEGEKKCRLLEDLKQIEREDEFVDFT